MFGISSVKVFYKQENMSESAMEWIDEAVKATTNTPEIVIEEETAIGTIIAIVVVALISITLLFVMAIFIDCRHQKLEKNKPKRNKKILKITVPQFGNRVIEQDDRCTFADKMYAEDSEPSNPAVIV